MDKTIFEVEISNSGPKSYETATVMKMPASFAEFSDALQKARIKDGSFCKNELTCIHYNGLTHAMIGWNANLYDLNLFAQRLASLTEEQKKGMDALLKIKQNHRVAPIPLNQLINLTYNTDICCFAPRVSNHEELGAFLYANEMLSNEAMALLDTTEEGSGFRERLLELLGEQHQEDHGGVFTDFGYSASLSADMEITPDEKNPTASGNSMKSGYGVNQVVTARVSSSQRSATTALQNAVSYFPEFNYESFWRLLDRISISSSSSRLEFQKNEYSTYNRRTHFTPIWYPDGSYTVNTWVIDCWTPAGMLSVNLTDSLNIRGNLWDDWHIAPLDL